jgi:hypothetical protein
MRTFIFEVRFSDGLHCKIAIEARTRSEALAELDERVEVGKLDYYLCR